MKSLLKTLMIVFMCMMLSACSNEKTFFEDVNYEYDNQNYFYSFYKIAATKNGYYYEADEVLKFFDKKSRISFPVCSKINCNHYKDSKNCNALMKNMGKSGLWYYNEKIYYVSYDKNSNYYCIVAISADGSKQTKICNILKKDITEEELEDDIIWGDDIDSFIIHRDYAYYTYVTDEFKSCLYKIELRKNAVPELVQQEDYIFELKGYKNGIYYSVFSSAEENSYNYCVYDIENLKNKVLMKNQYVGDCSFYDESIYYIKGYDIIKYDLIKQKEEKVYTVNQKGLLSSDGRYFYFDNCPEADINGEDRKVLILNTDFSVYDTINLSKDFSVNLFGDEHYMFCLAFKDDNLIIKAFDKSQIGTDSREFIELK